MKDDWLQAFGEFSESLNFTRAAEKLHISQPALHVKIQKLVEAVGVPLYEKQGRVLLLTEAGVKVQGFAREMHERRQAFLAGLRCTDDRQPVVLCAGEGVYLYLLGPALMAYQRSRHGLGMRLLTGNSQLTVQTVLSGRAHLGITAMNAVHDELESVALTTVGQALVMPKFHALSQKARISLRDLDGQQLILPPSNRPHRLMVEQALEQENVNWSLAVEAVGWELMIHFVRLGSGLAIVNECCKIPAGLVKKSLTMLPKLTYTIVTRKHGWYGQSVYLLRKTLLRFHDHWKKS